MIKHFTVQVIEDFYVNMMLLLGKSYNLYNTFLTKNNSYKNLVSSEDWTHEFWFTRPAL